MRRIMAQSFFIILLWLVNLEAITALPPQVYPLAQLTPIAPVDGDSVTLFYILGKKTNSCVPTYSTTVKGVELHPIYCIKAPCPQNYVIHVEYKEIPLNLLVDTLCPQVITSYGPRFNLGKLTFGNYLVVNGVDTLTRFSVGEPIVKNKITGVVQENVYPLKSLKLLSDVKVYLYSNSGPIQIGQFVNLQSIFGSTIIDSAVTDQSGSFFLHDNGPGSYQISYARSGYQTYINSVRTTKDTVVNASLLPINAKISISGKVSEYYPPSIPALGLLIPIPGCTLTIEYAQSPTGPHSVAIMIQLFKAISDVKGTFVFDSIPVNYNSRATIRVKKDGFAPIDSTITVQKGYPITANFRLQKLNSNSNTVTVDGVNFTLSTDKSSYKVGETISARYTIVNRSMAMVTYSITPGCESDMLIKGQKGDTLYWHMDKRACVMMIGSLSIEPGDSTTYYFPPYTINKYSDSVLTVYSNLVGYPKSQASVNIRVVAPVKTISQLNTRNALNINAVRYLNEKRSIALNVDKPQMITITAVVLNGRSSQSFAKTRFMQAGYHELKLDNTKTSNGIMIVSVKGNNMNRVIKVDLTNR